MAADQFYPSRSQTTVEANQNLFPSKEEAREIKSNSEVVLACRGRDRSLLHFESPKLLQLSLMSVVELR